jgi:hypothetical protein
MAVGFAEMLVNPYKMAWRLILEDCDVCNKTGYCTCNITWRCLCMIIVAVEKKEVLPYSECVSVALVI